MMESCPICRHDCLTEWDKKDKAYHICSSCGFTFLDKIYHLTAVEEKKRYELHNNDPEDEGYRKWLTAFIEQAVKPYISTDRPILDFGSGPVPVLAALLREEGYSVKTYDKYFAPEEVAGPFAMITSTEVIEHVADPLNLLKKLLTLVEAGGFIALKTAFRPAEDEKFFKWWYREDSTHISFFTIDSFGEMAEKTGLTIQFCDNRSVVILRK